MGIDFLRAREIFSICKNCKHWEDSVCRNVNVGIKSGTKPVVVSDDPYAGLETPEDFGCKNFRQKHG